MNKFMVFQSTTLVLTLAATTAFSAPVDYLCEFDAAHTQGWAPEKALITVDEDANASTVVLSNYSESSKSGLPGRIRSTGRMLTVTVDVDDAGTTDGDAIRVRNSFRIRRADGQATLNVQVGRHGQREHARGRCAVQ